MGPAGLSAVLDLVPALRDELAADAVIANGENSAPGGRGVTAESAADLLSVVDFLTLGNHAFDVEGHEKLLEREHRIVRPANFPDYRPGRGWGTFEANGARVGVTNVLGQVFVDRGQSSAFRAADRAVEELGAQGADIVLVDSHAEATSEKQALGHHLAGRVQAVLGTHTHVPTADFTVLPGGTAYASDVGMTGCQDSVIGFDREIFVGLFLGERRRLTVATRGPVVLNAALIDFDLEARAAVTVEPVRRRWEP